MLAYLFIGVALICLLGMVAMFVAGRADEVASRLEDLSAGGTGTLVGAPRGAAIDPTQRPKLRANTRKVGRRGISEELTFRDRMVQAGLYGVHTARLLELVRVASFAIPFLTGVFFAWQGVMPAWQALLIGCVTGGIGVVAPSFWLDYRRAQRQTTMRRALPDALDTIIVCLEGGLSLAAAFARVGNELACAHPMLAIELKIVEREVQMGRTVGEAIRGMALRFGLEEIRSMSAVILHSERYGASVTKALDIFAQSLRLRRRQRAEETAHKAAVKILFPTVLFILPATFVVILGPAVVRMQDTLAPMMNK